MKKICGFRAGYVTVIKACKSKRLIRKLIKMVRLFNPRTQNWNRHFKWNNEKIVGRTACGWATTVALKLNNEIILPVRKRWIEAGWFPPEN